MNSQRARQIRRAGRRRFPGGRVPGWAYRAAMRGWTELSRPEKQRLAEEGL